jgi:hypothetical protein
VRRVVWATVQLALALDDSAQGEVTSAVYSWLIGTSATVRPLDKHDRRTELTVYSRSRLRNCEHGNPRRYAELSHLSVGAGLDLLLDQKYFVLRVADVRRSYEELAATGVRFDGDPFDRLAIPSQPCATRGRTCLSIFTRSRAASRTS